MRQAFQSLPKHTYIVAILDDQFGDQYRGIFREDLQF